MHDMFIVCFASFVLIILIEMCVCAKVNRRMSGKDDDQQQTEYDDGGGGGDIEKFHMKILFR